MIIKAAFGMESELPSNLTIECVEQAINDINTESDLAALFAVVENKAWWIEEDRKSTRLNSSHSGESRMPSSA